MKAHIISGGVGRTIAVYCFPSVHYRNPVLPRIRIEWADGTCRLIAEFRKEDPEESFRCTDGMGQYYGELRQLAIDYKEL